MNVEEMEHILNEIAGESVIVVQPGFGHQSNSFVGNLNVVFSGCPFVFSISGAVSVLFDANDIDRLDKSHDNKYIIRLKGPNDYSRKCLCEA